MPELTGEDWDMILNNVCFIAFMQGIPVGMTTYNDYVIVASSENKEIASENLIYFVNEDENRKCSTVLIIEFGVLILKIMKIN